MMQWLKQLFCVHRWRVTGRQDYCNFAQVFHDNGVRRRVTYVTCEFCDKRATRETMIDL